MANLDLIKQNHEKAEKLRLNTYLEKVRQSIASTAGELQAFWKREEKKTQQRLAKFV